MNHPQVAGRRILLVEGPDDEHVVKSICGRLKLGIIDKVHYGNPPSAQKQGTQGKEALLQSLPEHLRASDLLSLGIVLDADENPTGSWESIRQVLIEKGYPDVPKNPAQEGTVVSPPPEPTLLPRVGIWIMPNNETKGTLENFLHFLVPEGDILLSHARQVIGTLPEIRFTHAHQSKALMHTWLAWQKEPGKPYGQAITARYLDINLPAAKTFASWLKRTFFE